MMRGPEGGAAGLEHAFPSGLRADAVRAIATLPDSPLAPVSGFSVVLDGEQIRIPYRIYHPEPSAASLGTLPAAQLVIVHCLYTRHHDGFVRQRHLVAVLAEPHIWTAPFALQLLGEYVAQIHVVLQKHEGVITSAPYRRFCAQNPEFVERTKRRIVSYWDAYYRWQGTGREDLVFRRLAEYPAFLVADALGWWGPRDLPRVRAR